MSKTVIFVCRSCHQRLRAPRDRVGERAKCPRCGQPLAVPNPFDVVAAAALALARAVLARLRARRRWLAAGAIVALAAAGLAFLGWRLWQPSYHDDPEPELRSAAQIAALTGTRFRPAPLVPSLPPTLTALPVPTVPGAVAIRGATGVDREGHIWFAVSTTDGKGGPQGTTTEPSARLFEFRPQTREVVDRGDPISQLKEAGLLRAGERQRAIDTKIVPGPDGALYFASSDELGSQSERAMKPPRWGSHLWRLKRGAARWEHLLTVPDHVIAVAAGGRHVFALGWPGHHLYACDIDTGAIERAAAGSVPGHMSRHMMADIRGHAYVPRLRFTAETPSRLAVTLVEFSPGLHELGETPLAHYVAKDESRQHGITGVQTLTDLSIAFVTAAGYLYQVKPRKGAPAEVAALGWCDPKGEMYVSSLFTYEGQRYLAGVSDREGQKHWFVFDLATRTSTALALPRTGEVMDISGAKEKQSSPDRVVDTGPGCVLSGCSTRDDRGSFYLSGSLGGDPVIFQAAPTEIP
jgi:hypothetical protein